MRVSMKKRGAMVDFTKLSTWEDKVRIHAVVETPRGSRSKLSFDPNLPVFVLDKPLLAGLTYPYDWGFIPSTKPVCSSRTKRLISSTDFLSIVASCAGHPPPVRVAMKNVRCPRYNGHQRILLTGLSEFSIPGFD